MQIRELTPEDGLAFWELRGRALREEPHAFGSSYEDFLARGPEAAITRLVERGLAGDNFVLGAWEGDRIVGIAGFERNEGAKVRHNGWIWGVYVAPEGRGQGVGRALMEALIARARALPGLEQLNLGVAVENPAARALYDSLGFVAYGREPRTLYVNGRYLDEDLMILFFQP